MPAIGSRRVDAKVLIVLGVVVVLVAAGAFFGIRWWNDYKRVSQASAEDCRTAARIVEEGKALGADPVEAERWQERSRELRAGMRDGYLGFRIAVYEGWAAAVATGSTDRPDRAAIADSMAAAREHCEDARVDLPFPDPR
ncbi:hypothetical protein [Actinosynnema pretiosum]|uniref:Uncharacterized protein n=1 Tax=Actinosynnema pretiosum TaxID=42197 RepID=A0A290Z8K2_9PSEU|nr:hypothetical protein [Actinosynnema pretiosum]ATE55326.1 hypothetical protein CNX65_20275 [Actinosynnema pretiosum]